MHVHDIGVSQAEVALGSWGLVDEQTNRGWS